MTRSCHGLFTYFRPRGHESLALLNCASTPCIFGSGKRTPGAGSAGRGPVEVPPPPPPGTVVEAPPAVVNAITFDHGPIASFSSARTRHSTRLLAASAGSTVYRVTPDASVTPIPLARMLVNESESLT